MTTFPILFTMVYWRIQRNKNLSYLVKGKPWIFWSYRERKAAERMIALTLNAESDCTTVAITPLLHYLNEQTAPENLDHHSDCWLSLSCASSVVFGGTGRCTGSNPVGATFRERTRRQIPLSFLFPFFLIKILFQWNFSKQLHYLTVAINRLSQVFVWDVLALFHWS